VAAIAAALAGRPGALAAVGRDDPTPRRAAVALVLRVPVGAAGPELLLVKRAEYPGDPWSGHVAFPGGRAEPDDASPWHTAARETWEETGLDLLAAGRLLGTLDELYPRTPVLPPVVVRPHVAVVGGRAGRWC
jgi:8-oxo-dGTP pyrophosphatase MutT (NUDIX family)